MENSPIVDSIFNWARAQELMDNIKRMNDLVELHTKAESSTLIIYQYQEMKNNFIAELNEMFRFYSLVVREKTKRKKKNAMI